ncbi:hypothetical protein PRIPAC_79764 [Pristionchus pacificus]|uniref:G protein-coupled receptor n=1 Tax=Pristionchus pacificus TaxID=54126 RepID=A0A2A6CN97_PRIPA|nr:hypothetical protein PRIPAC_79764 [Pristionchus pacificus]|eukprot:PDM79567.1 G protein-coupled receptor [Pristionchus pacificus]
MSSSSIVDALVHLHLVGGVVVNEVLLYAIRRFSRPSMGTYKYLLAAFATFDVFLSLLHAATRPTVVIVDKVFGVVTDCYFEEDRNTENKYKTAANHVPYALMNIHFLYRFWAIRYPHQIALFSNKKFITFISAIPLLDFSLWAVVFSMK